MRYLMLLLLPAMAVAGCGGKPSPPPAANPAAPAATVAPEAHELDIGDVETAITLQGVLAPESRAGGIKVDTLEGRNKAIVMATVHVAPPPPRELWFEYSVKSLQPFPDRPVALRFSVLRSIGPQDDPIAEYAVVLGADAHLASDPPRSVRVNALAGLDSMPESMLLHVRGELILLPPGAGPASVDPRSVTAGPDDVSSALQCNPVRIELTTGAAQ